MRVPVPSRQAKGNTVTVERLDLAKFALSTSLRMKLGDRGGGATYSVTQLRPSELTRILCLAGIFMITKFHLEGVKKEGPPHPCC